MYVKNIPGCRSEMSFGQTLMRWPSDATQAHCKNMPVATFVQNDISLLLGCFSKLKVKRLVSTGKAH